MYQIVSPLETAAFIAPVSSICACLLQVQALLWQRREPIFVGHIRGHSMLPGPLAQGNELADSYTRPSCCYVLMNGTAYDKALQMHRKFHLFFYFIKILSLFHMYICLPTISTSDHHYYYVLS